MTYICSFGVAGGLLVLMASDESGISDEERESSGLGKIFTDRAKDGVVTEHAYQSRVEQVLWKLDQRDA
ncbi:hypothetical protein [Kosakonia cowanii]|uniref:hypothetical protein n=1 Tax=Kosakonia cowanii TaxID=208223 RepID=UPI0028AE15CA|nr:hypothetical protein [Kosakonia cowanii]